MFGFKAVHISSKLVALAAAVFIAITMPTASTAALLADGGTPSQYPPAATPDGNSWGG